MNVFQRIPHRVICMVLLLWGVGPFRGPALGATPNVVLIISDDQGWTDYGFMGHSHIRTPNLDRLASRSQVFTRGYVPASLCRPSLATLATGLFPHQHKITSNDPPGGAKDRVFESRRKMISVFEQVPTLAGLLATKGYVSHQSGKWWEGHCRCGDFTDGMTHGDPKRGGRHGDEGLEIGRKTMQPIYDFIAKAGTKPFFLWYAPFLPHTPHNPPERLLAKYRSANRPVALAKYYAMCEWFDETCGQLLDHLDARGLSKTTLVVYVTDNGWIQATSETPLPSGWSMPYAPKSKRSPYDMGIRTPILLRWPGRISPDRDDRTLVHSVDLAPTILRACGLDPTKDMRGVNLLDKKALSKRKSIFGAIYTHDAVDIHSPSANLLYRWVIAGQWKLIVPHRLNVPDRKSELYHLGDDSHETHDLGSTRPEVTKRLRELADLWWKIPSR